MENWSEIEFICLKQLQLKPHELDMLEFWRVEMLLDRYKEWLEQEKDRRRKEEKENHLVGDYSRQQSSMAKSFSQPKLPSLPRGIPGMPKF